MCINQISIKCILILFFSPISLFCREGTLPVIEQKFKDQKYEEVIELIHQLLETDSLQKDTLTRASSISMLGNSYRHLGRIQKAIHQHKVALDLRKQLFGPASLAVADTYQNLGNCFLDTREYKKAIDYFNQSKEIRNTHLPNNHPDQAKILNSIGNYYLDIQEYASALHTFSLAYQILEKNFGSESLRLLPNLINQANALFQTDQLEEAVVILEKALKIQYKENGKFHPISFVILTNLSNALLKQELLRQTAGYIEEGLSIIDSMEYTDILSLGPFYQTVGIYYLALKESDTALPYFEKSLSFLEQLSVTNPSSIADLYSYLAQCYENKEDYFRAIQFYEQSLEVARDNNLEEEKLLPLYYNLGLCYSKQGNFQPSQYYLNEAVASETAMLKVKALLALGDTHLINSENKEATRYYEQAISELKYDPNPSLFFDAYYRMGQIAFKVEDFEKSIQLYEKAFGYFGYIKDSLLFPLSYQEKAIDYYTARAKAIQEIALLNNSRDSLLLAYDLYRKALQVSKKLRSISIEIPSSRNRDLYNGLIEVTHFISPFNKTYRDSCFYYIEQSKATQLANLLHSEEIKRLGLIPPSLDSKQQKLKQQMLALEKEKQQYVDSYDLYYSSISDINIQLDSLHKAHDLLEQCLQINYPTYYTLVNQSPVIKMETIQNILPESHTFLNYYISEQYILIAVIDGDSVVTYATPKPKDFSQEVATLYQSIYQNPTNSNYTDSLQEQYTLLASKYYQLLIQPFRANLKDSILLVSPHHILHYLPFEVLLDTTPSAIHLYKCHPYLVHDFTISYTPSALLFQQMSNRTIEPKKQTILSFAPSFMEGKYAKLDNNTKEVKAIHQRYRGTYFLEEDATKNAFKENASDHQILHLSTHAIMDDQSEDHSFIVFSGKEDNLLYAHELYQLSLNSELVVLSACQTGIGKFKYGEGLLSLSRAFAYAGTKSIVATLWSVADLQTSELVQLFYAAFEQKMNKAQALRAAKLQYLKACKNQTLAHPYYWAALILNGDTSEIIVPTNSKKWKWLVAFLIASFLLVVLFKT